MAKSPLPSKLIKQEAHRLGFDLCRVVPAGETPHFGFFTAWLEQGCSGEMTYLQRNTEKRRWPARLASAGDHPYRSMVILAVNYYQNSTGTAELHDPSRGVIAKYARGEDYHDLIRPRLYELDIFIARQSGRSSPGKCLVDSGPVLERDWAQLAGIGFTGKNCCTINPCLGSWLLLATVLVPEELEYDSMQPWESLHIDANRIIAGLPEKRDYGAWKIPVEDDRLERIDEKTGTCGSCSRCLNACPTQAFVGPYYLDPRRCISYWTIEARGIIPRDLRSSFGIRIFGCDVCQYVCPWNRRLEHRAPSILRLSLQLVPAALPLLQGFDPANPYWVDDAAFVKRFKGTPLLRPERTGMLRNVCVALGNWGAIKALPALDISLDDLDPIVRAHAAWAVGEVARKNGVGDGGSLLRNRLGLETDSRVLEEIRLALQ